MPELQTPALEHWSIEPRSESIAARAAELWRYRRMFLFFGDRAIRKLYQQTVLGKAWIFLRPLVPLFARVFLFGALLEVGSATRAPYFVFLAVGSAAWELFASCVMWATRSMQMNGGILSRLYVPRVIVPIATMAPGFVYFLINVGVIIGALAYYRIRDGVWHVDSTWMIVAPAAAVLIILFAVSIGLWTSVLAAEARDVRFGLAFALEFWTYVTPVVYPLSLVPDHVQWALMLNPMAVYVVAFRGAILGGEGPSPWAWASAIGITAVMLVVGLAFFQRAEAEAVDSL
jgi:homopolymeric O-antigen transport system permease protein